MKQQDKYTIAAAHFDTAYKLHLDGKLAEAIDEYIVSIKLHPTAKAHTFLGWAFSLIGRFEEAIEQCRIAIELDPEFGNPYNDIGSYLISLGRYKEAVSWLQLAIESKDYEPRHYPFYNLGVVYEKTGEWITAMRYYNDALEIKPDYESAQTAILRLTTLLN